MILRVCFLLLESSESDPDMIYGCITILTPLKKLNRTAAQLSTLLSLGFNFFWILSRK